MDLPSYSINENFRKCGEITTAVKVGKKVYALNCGFCSRVFIKIHAFALHVGENHEQELFGCLKGNSCEELLLGKRKKNILTESEDNNDDDATTVETKFDQMIKDEDFQDPLGQPIQNIMSEEVVKKEEETMLREGNYDNEDEIMKSINEEDEQFNSRDSSECSDEINDALADEDQKWKLPLLTLTDSENLELIEMYKSFPCLWNMEHIEFHITIRRQEAINEMIQKLKTKMNLNVTQDKLKKVIHSIRDAYTQETQRKLKCERLKNIFKPLCKFYEQVSFLKNNVRPFKCDFCKETFNGFIRYKIHKSKHDGSMPFTCPLCNHGFMDISNCIVHVRAHTREKPYFCEICGQCFGTRSSFNVHKRRHKERPNHICTICSKAFYEKFKLTEHMNAHLNIRNKVCKICGRAFTSSKYLTQHKQIHADVKKYVCRICGKDFAQAAGLNGHMKSHGTTMTGN